MAKRVRLNADVRKENILKAAINVAKIHGLSAVTRIDLSVQMNVTAGAISYHFKNRKVLLDAIIEYALEHDIDRIIFDAIVSKHEAIKDMHADVKSKIIAKFI